MAIFTLDGGASSASLGGQTIPYAELLIAQTVSGAPDTLIRTHLMRVLNDFYTRSTAWRENVGPYTISKGIADVYLNPVDQNKQLQFVLGAYMFPSLDNANTPTPIYPTTRQFLGGTPAPPSRYYMQTPDHMVLYPIPDQFYGAVLYAYACLTPVNLSAILPNMSYTHHMDAIVWGTLARLYAIPKRPWSDKDLARDMMNKYRQQVLIYRDIANRGYGPADTGFRFPAFAGRAGSQILPKAVG